MTNLMFFANKMLSKRSEESVAPRLGSASRGPGPRRPGAPGRVLDYTTPEPANAMTPVSVVMGDGVALIRIVGEGAAPAILASRPGALPPPTRAATASRAAPSPTDASGAGHSPAPTLRCLSDRSAPEPARGGEETAGLSP